MAKRIHPNSRSIRSGQTVYWINYYIDYRPESRPPAAIEPLRIGSHRTINNEGEMVTITNLNLFKRVLSGGFVKPIVFYSRKRAQTYIDKNFSATEVFHGAT